MDTDDQIREAARRMGSVRNANKSAANPKVAKRLAKATRAATLAKIKPLEEILCCGRDPHLKSCLRWRAMQRRTAAGAADR